MAVGITGTNPELVIEVTYDSQQSQQEFNKFKTKLERDAQVHEQKLKQIQEKGDATRRVSKDKFQDKLEQQEKLHQDKLRRMHEVANQKLLQQQKAYEARMLRSQSSWSARMAKGLGTLVTSVKAFALAYATAFIGGAIRDGLENIDEIAKTARDLGLSFEYLQSKVIQFSLVGLNQEKTLGLLNELNFALKDKTQQAYKDLLKAGIDTTKGLEVAWQQLVDYAKNNPNEAIVYEKRRYADFVRAVSASEQDLLRAQEILRNLGISEADIKSIEKFNDAMTTLGAVFQLIVGKVFANSSAQLTEIINKLIDDLSNVDWAAVADGIVAFIKLGEVVGKAYAHIYKFVTLVKIFASANIWDKIFPLAAGFTEMSTAFAVFLMRFKTFETIAVKLLIPLNKGTFYILQLGKYIEKIFVPFNKLLGLFGKFGVWLGKISVWLTVFFTILDFVDALNEGLSVTDAFFYSISKILTDVIDALVYIFTLGKIDLGLSDDLKEFYGINTELEKTKKHYDDLKSSMNGLASAGATHLQVIGGFLESIGYSADRVVKIFAKFQPFSDSENDVKAFLTYLGYSGKALDDLVASYIKFKKEQEAATGGGGGNGAQTYFGELKKNLEDTINKTKNLKSDTERYIALLNDYKNKYSDNVAVVAEVNKQLVEQQEILQNIYGDEYVLKFGLPDAEALGYDFANDLKKEIESYLAKNPIELIPADATLYGHIQEDIKQLNYLRSQLRVLETMRDLTAEGSDEFKILSRRIEETKGTIYGLLGGPPSQDLSFWDQIWNDMEQSLISYTDKLNFANQVMGEFSNLLNAMSDATVQGLYNQLEVLQEIIRLENERWSAADAAMENSGVKNTAYYIKLKKDHEKYVKALEEREYQLKGDAWDADKQAKITQTIMNTAQAIVAAWAAGPFIGAIMSGIIAATGAIQLQTISSQENPYRRALGGWIPGSTYGDDVPTLLTPGEYVVNRTAARENAGLLEMINAGRQPVGGTSIVTNISIDGNLVSNEEWVEQELIPTINKAIIKGYELRVN